MKNGIMPNAASHTASQANPYPELQQLKGIQLPDPVSAWPPSPSVWIALILLMVIIGFALFQWYRYRRQTLLRRTALKELNRLCQQTQQPIARINAIATLLRRVSLSHFPPEEVAPLTGKAWLHFLDQRFDPSGQANLFREGPGTLIETVRFFASDVENQAPKSHHPGLPDNLDQQTQELIQLADRWIKKIC